VNGGISWPNDFLSNPLDSWEKNFPIVRDFTGEGEDMLKALLKVGVDLKTIVAKKR